MSVEEIENKIFLYERNISNENNYLNDNLKKILITNKNLKNEICTLNNHILTIS